MTGVATPRVGPTGMRLLREQRGTVALENLGPGVCHVRSCGSPARFLVTCQCERPAASCARHVSRVVDVLVVDCLVSDPHPGVLVRPVW